MRGALFSGHEACEDGEAERGKVRLSSAHDDNPATHPPPEVGLPRIPGEFVRLTTHDFSSGDSNKKAHHSALP